MRGARTRARAARLHTTPHGRRRLACTPVLMLSDDVFPRAPRPAARVADQYDSSLMGDASGGGGAGGSGGGVAMDASAADIAAAVGALQARVRALEDALVIATADSTAARCVGAW